MESHLEENAFCVCAIKLSIAIVQAKSYKMVCKMIEHTVGWVYFILNEESYIQRK